MSSCRPGSRRSLRDAASPDRLDGSPANTSMRSWRAAAAAIAVRVIEQAEPGLEREDAADGVVDAVGGQFLGRGPGASV